MLKRGNFKTLSCLTTDKATSASLEKIVENLDEPTDEEVGEVCIQLRHLSPDISINPQGKSAIRSFWHNVPAGLARVKNAIAQGWCKQATSVFVQTLKNGASRDEEVLVIAKEYPRPTLEQLNQLGEMGELVYTKLNEPGYPEVVAVNTGVGLLTKVGCVGSKATVIIRRYLRNAGNFSLTKFYQLKKRSPFNSPSQSTLVPPSQLLAAV